MSPTEKKLPACDFVTFGISYIKPMRVGWKTKKERFGYHVIWLQQRGILLHLDFVHPIGRHL
ncbi:MAG: hypothetical protein FWF59_11340 [Turicibacter sp.]|nr:hypothetical protein [Turicibacter sp.]